MTKNLYNNLSYQIFSINDNFDDYPSCFHLSFFLFSFFPQKKIIGSFPKICAGFNSGRWMKNLSGSKVEVADDAS